MYALGMPAHVHAYNLCMVGWLLACALQVTHAGKEVHVVVMKA